MFDVLASLLRDVGLEADLLNIKDLLNSENEPEFIEGKVLLDDALHGLDVNIGQRIWHLNEIFNRLYAKKIPDKYNFIVVNDAGLIALKSHWNKPLRSRIIGPKHKTYWIWWCHQNASGVNEKVWKNIQYHLDHYDAAIFTMKEHKPPMLQNTPPIYCFPPSIDPFIPKNIMDSSSEHFLTMEKCCKRIAKYSIDVQRPILLQVARFSPTKDQKGVVDAYRIVKAAEPKTQLVLLGYLPDDDPSSSMYYQQLLQYAKGDPDIHVISPFGSDSELDVSAFQRMARVNILLSIEEGFGLVLTEAMWKEIPVVGKNVGGIRHQIIDKENGFLVNSIEECADRCIQILSNSKLASRISLNGKKHVATNYLSIHHLYYYLILFNAVVHQ